jgi:hypothetical protein
MITESVPKSSITVDMAFRKDLTLQGCTTLPTRADRLLTPESLALIHGRPVEGGRPRPFTTRNVLTSDPLISSLDRHNGWSMTILWRKNDRQKRGVVDDRTWRIHWDRHNRLWRYWTIIMLMTIQYRHGQFEEATSAIQRGIRVAGGHISNPTWNTRGRHVNWNQPNPFQWSIWAKPNKSSLFPWALASFWSISLLGRIAFLHPFFIFYS